MPTSAHLHPRRPLPSNAKTRPTALHRRGLSSNAMHTLGGGGHGHGSTGKSLLGGSKKSFTEIVDDSDDEDFGTASFLQFCATCEKQIVSPGSNILYCSEACRERDISHAHSYQPPPSPPTGPPLGLRKSSNCDDHPPDILPRRSPTVLRPVSMTFFDLSEECSRLSAEELDLNSHHQQRYRPSTDPATYPRLTTLHRPQPIRHSSTADHSLPSLSHTPSSSFGTAASTSGPSDQPYLTSTHPRHDSSTNMSIYPRNRKSIDLVTPYYPPRPGSSYHPDGEDDESDPESTSQRRRRSSLFLSDHHHHHHHHPHGSLKSSVSTLTSLHAAEAETREWKAEPQPQQRRNDSIVSVSPGAAAAATAPEARTGPAQGSLRALMGGRPRS